MLTPEQREIRKLKAAMRELSMTVAACLEALDRQMRQPSTVERGKNIAKICNVLELQNDSVLHSTLHYTFPQMKVMKKKAIKEYGG